MFQQANLVVPASSSPQATSNHIAATLLISTTISAPESSSTGIIPKSSYWLLDSGANEHISCNLSCFTSFYKIPPVYVSLPNGNSILVYYAGTVTFTSNFYLNHVLYSAAFTLNFISVAKLCGSLSYSLHFTSIHYIIHDKMYLKMIGLAKQLNGLYKYIPSSCSSNSVFSSISNKSCNVVLPVSCNSSSSIPSHALWHFRLGHLSRQRLHPMSLLYPNIISNNDKNVCDLCHFAKHKHLPFTPSTSHASANFELIHLDF